MKSIRKILDRIETIILGLSILGVFFFIIQLGFIKDMEVPAFYYGDEYSTVDTVTEKSEPGYIVLKKSTDKFKDVHIIVNGDKNYKFNEDNEITLKVFDRDVISVDCTMYENEIEIIVVGISKNIVKPRLNDRIVVKNEIKEIFQVNIY